MADTSGQADLRGIEIDKISKDMFEEELIFKKEVKNESTKARHVRWYQKTSGYITMTAPAKISPIAYGAKPFVAEQSWTRVNSYVKKYFLESPTINMEDESDSDVQVFMNNLQDLTAAVANALDADIWNVLTENQVPVNINTVASTAAWGAASGQDPFEDVMDSIRLIREQTKRKIRNGALYVSAQGEKDIMVWLVSIKGSSVPGYSSQLVQSGSLVGFAGLRVVVSENVTADKAAVADFSQAGIYKEFKPLTTAIIKDEGIGRKIRVWTHGITLLSKPKYVCLITNTE